jgi:hypothetical protein
MRSPLIAVLALALASPALAAPDPQETAVVAAVQRFFDAMAAHDGAALSQAALPGSVFTAIRPAAAGATKVTRITLEDFTKNLRPGLSERMWSPRVSLRGAMLATLSAPYEFQLDGKTTHCGIDVFELAKIEGQWKIASISWTAEPDACPELKAR